MSVATAIGADRRTRGSRAIARKSSMREVVGHPAERGGAGGLDLARQHDQEVAAERRELVHHVAPRALAERGERDHRGDPDRDAGDRQSRPQAVAAKRPGGEPHEVEQPHVTSARVRGPGSGLGRTRSFPVPGARSPVPCIAPSSIRTTRRARSAIAGSWVTTTSVSPRRFIPSISSITSSAEARSRLPVGSSASNTAGSITTARAIATRCRSPPESWSGRWAARCVEPDRVERRPPRAPAAPRGRRPGEQHRQLDVAERREARQQVEELEHETDPVPAQQRALLLRERADLAPLEQVAPARRPVEAADDVQQRGLAGAGGPDERDVLAARDRRGRRP